MTKDKFIEEVKKLGIEINNIQLEQLNKYYELLIEWNKVMNLTGIVEEEEVYLKHFYDSLTLYKVINLNNIENLCDVGTGAGFPGIVLKILFPTLKITLIDSLQKRINFLNEVIKSLDLKDIEAIHFRIEEYAINGRDKFDLVTARAVAPLNILSEYCLPLVKENGYFIAMKGNALEEINNSRNALNLLNSHIERIEEFTLPIEESQRTLIKVKKTDKTSKKYPRKYNEIKKNPL